MFDSLRKDIEFLATARTHVPSLGLYSAGIFLCDFYIHKLFFHSIFSIVTEIDNTNIRMYLFSLSIFNIKIKIECTHLVEGDEAVVVTEERVDVTGAASLQLLGVHSNVLVAQLFVTIGTEEHSLFERYAEDGCFRGGEGVSASESGRHGIGENVTTET